MDMEFTFSTYWKTYKIRIHFSTKFVIKIEKK